uniref:SSD domain-containing protein n=2 Tax=Bursaphelenchus xylophilus TaxID=6326 RepID=A0A1I7RI20_BURXY
MPIIQPIVQIVPIIHISTACDDLPNTRSRATITDSASFLPKIMVQSMENGFGVTTISVTSSEESTPTTSDADLTSEKNVKLSGTCVNQMSDKMFRKIGHLVADYPVTTLIIISIFTLITSVKVALTDQEDDLKTGYTPIGARSYDEFAAYEKFYDNIGGEPLNTIIFVTPKYPNGSMIGASELNETMELVDYIGAHFKLTGRPFYKFCTDFCEMNEPIRQFRNGIILNDELNKSNQTAVDTSDDRLELNFPFMSILGKQLDLSPNFFGVEKFENLVDQMTAGSPTNIKNLKLILVQLRADKPSNASKNDVVEYERQITDFVNKQYNGRSIRPLALTVTLARDEIIRTGMTLFPYLSVGFAIMVTFSIISVFFSAFYYNQWTKHKLSLAIMGCICPLLATSSALGFLFWFRVRFGTILAVTPFLVMAIGVDDAYLMIHSWQRICSKQSKKRSLAPRNVLLGDSLRDRIAEVMVDVGPAITITSLTNILAFGVGTFAPTPEIRLFCAGNTMAIFFDYIYQLFMYGPVIALVGKFEMSDEEAMDQRKTRDHNRLRRWLREKLLTFMSSYCAWISNSFTSVLVLLILIVYWLTSLNGTLSITPRITPKKLFLADSVINDMNMLRDEYIQQSYSPMTLFINNATNLEDPIRNARIREMIRRFEGEKHSLGAEFSHFWLRDYDRFMETAAEETEEEEQEVSDHSLRYDRHHLDAFLNWPEYHHWGGFLRFDNETGDLSKFMVIMGFHGKELVAWEYRAVLLNQWRSIVDEFPEFSASVWVDDAPFLDQIQTLVPVTIQSSICTLICMIVVCLLFMHHLFSLSVATLSIVSICLGVFGSMFYWGLDLDPISMATTIMSIGFSVDFPAHITYHYYRMGEDHRCLSPQQRIFHSLVSIGYPLIQCGLSTIFFVMCLRFVDTYMSEVFVKTMVLVVSLGVIHGLFIIPTMLCACSNVYDACRSIKRPRKHRKTTEFSRQNRPKIIPIGSFMTKN